MQEVKVLLGDRWFSKTMTTVDGKITDILASCIGYYALCILVHTFPKKQRSVLMHWSPHVSLRQEASSELVS